MKRGELMKNFVKFISLTLILISTLFTFTACLPNDVDSAIKKLEGADYVVTEPTIASYEESAGVIGKIKAHKLSEDASPTYTIIALFFESEEKAKKYYENEGGWHDSVLTKTGCEGRWAYASNSDVAIKDFKK